MKLKLLLVAALAFIFVSCGGTGSNPAAKKKAASTSFSAISAFGPAIFGSISKASKSLRPQATTTSPLTCSPGSGTITFTDSPTSASINLKSTSGCTNAGTTIQTGATGFNLSFTGSGNFETTFTLTMTFNGSVTITTSGTTQTLVYTNLAITMSVNNTGAQPTGSISINGSVSVDGQTQTFNNDTYSFTDLQ